MVCPVVGLKTDKSDSQCKSHIKLKPVTYVYVFSFFSHLTISVTFSICLSVSFSLFQRKCHAVITRTLFRCLSLSLFLSFTLCLYLPLCQRWCQ